MGPDRVIHTVSCHAEGEVGDVIVDGVPPPPGETLWEQARWIDTDGSLRNLLLNEPRGGVFRHVNLLVPPRNPTAQLGFIIMEPMHTPPMSGSNAMCVATVVLETGLVPMVEPVTHLVLEAPGGLVEVEARCAAGKVESVTLTNVASFVSQLDATIEVEGFGSLRVDTAFGGDSFVMVDAADIQLEVVPEAAAELASAGARITLAANQQLGFSHPGNGTDLEWNHISFCQIAESLESEPGSAGSDWTLKSTSVIDPGKLDRSPTGTGVSARMAVLAARGAMDVGSRLTMRSVIDSTFVGTLAARTTVGERPAIIPRISGRAWLTGTHQHTIDPTDPWPEGYRLSDTWPGARRPRARPDA